MLKNRISSSASSRNNNGVEEEQQLSNSSTSNHSQHNQNNILDNTQQTPNSVGTNSVNNKAGGGGGGCVRGSGHSVTNQRRTVPSNLTQRKKLNRSPEVDSIGSSNTSLNSNSANANNSSGSSNNRGGRTTRVFTPSNKRSVSASVVGTRSPTPSSTGERHSSSSCPRDRRRSAPAQNYSKTGAHNSTGTSSAETTINPRHQSCHHQTSPPSPPFR